MKMAQASRSVKSISLSLTAQYAPSWKTWEGVRELVQNWHDGVFASLEKIKIAPSARSKVAFLSCKEKGSLLYKAVLTVGNSSEDTNSSGTVTNRTQKCDQAFDGTLSDDRRERCEFEEEGSMELGRIVYSPARERLTLVNHDTELMRKVLLLGFSKKASNKEVIGQFGEGLKVGALALVREGRVVSMETSRDQWKFGLSHDEAFDEEVLTVFVDDRWEESDEDNNDDDLNLGHTDTCVSVFPLCLDDWELYVKRFLFLCPPSDCVKSEIGTLLVDAHYKGQLYVKCVWVSDLSKDGLASGVDLVHLKIDRDRRAVIHLSEIDHQISSMWVHAIQQRPDLVPYYYNLLEHNKTSDVRHANFYLSGEAALLIAQRFFAIHGPKTYPIPNSVSAQRLHEIKQEIQEKSVLCNQSLIDVLYKSGAIEPLETILSRATIKKYFLVPYTELTQEEIDVLQHVEKLVQLCYPEFSLTSMDICKSAERVSFQKEFGHYKIPRALLSGKADHCCKQSSTTKCFCREALIATKILSLQPQELVQG